MLRSRASSCLLNCAQERLGAPVTFVQSDLCFAHLLMIPFPLEGTWCGLDPPPPLAGPQCPWCPRAVPPAAWLPGAVMCPQLATPSPAQALNPCRKRPPRLPRLVPVRKQSRPSAVCCGCHSCLSECPTTCPSAGPGDPGTIPGWSGPRGALEDSGPEAAGGCVGLSEHSGSRTPCPSVWAGHHGASCAHTETWRSVRSAVHPPSRPWFRHKTQIRTS